MHPLVAYLLGAASGVLLTCLLMLLGEHLGEISKLEEGVHTR